MIEKLKRIAQAIPRNDQARRLAREFHRDDVDLARRTGSRIERDGVLTARCNGLGKTEHEERLEASLRQVSGVLAEVESFYQREAERRSDSGIRDKYTEGWWDGQDMLLSRLSEILHQDDVSHLFDPSARMDSEGFVVVGDDRG